MTGRVVIAEDDAGLAFAYGRIVERLGYKVAVFNSTVTAWDDLKTDQRPSLLITDIVFPPDQPDGIALAAHAGVLHRHLPVIYVTGNPRSVRLMNNAPHEALLMKPVENDTLTQFVQKLAPRTTRADWHPADIAAALKKRGHSLANLSLSHGYHATAVGKALKQPWPAVERVIAAALERPPEEDLAEIATLTMGCQCPGQGPRRISSRIKPSSWRTPEGARRDISWQICRECRRSRSMTTGGN